MPYFKICPTCGAHLDPSEICEDCREEREKTKDAHSPVKLSGRLFENNPPRRITSKFYHALARQSSLKGV